MHLAAVPFLDRGRRRPDPSIHTTRSVGTRIIAILSSYPCITTTRKMSSLRPQPRPHSCPPRSTASLPPLSTGPVRWCEPVMMYATCEALEKCTELPPPRLHRPERKTEPLAISDTKKIGNARRRETGAPQNAVEAEGDLTNARV